MRLLRVFYGNRVSGLNEMKNTKSNFEMRWHSSYTDSSHFNLFYFEQKENRREAIKSIHKYLSFVTSVSVDYSLQLECSTSEIY